MYFVEKGKLYFANHHAGYKIPLHLFKTGICKMHVNVRHALLLSNGIYGTHDSVRHPS